MSWSQRTTSFQGVIACVLITKKQRATTNPTMVEWLHVDQMTHNNYIASCHSVYYAYKFNSNKKPSMHLSIVCDNMDMENTSIPRLGKKEKDISIVMNVSISLTSMLTHGHKVGGFDHFNISFLDPRVQN